jgi:hypothetical protein
MPNDEGRQLFIRVHNETLSDAAIVVSIILSICEYRSLFPTPGTRSAFHGRGQQNAFHRRDARQQALSPLANH